MSRLEMTWQEFLRDALAFLKISDKLKDNWSLLKQNDDEGGSFLIYKQKIPFPSNASSQQDDEFAKNCAKLSTQEEVPMPDEQLQANAAADWLQIEYHIVYSISYQVPVLYFYAHKSDDPVQRYRAHNGSILGLEEAWQLFRDFGNEFSAQAEQLPQKTRADMLSILTQMEHPVLLRPYLGLHPCRTAELLAQQTNSSNHVLTFISLMGPYVQLKLSNEYGLGLN